MGSTFRQRQLTSKLHICVLLLTMTAVLLNLCSGQECGFQCPGCVCFVRDANLQQYGLTCTDYRQTGFLSGCLNESVTYVSIHGGTIDKLRNGDLSGGAKLQTLEIVGNILSDIEGNVFDSTPLLEILDLSDNTLTKLDPNLFNNLDKLTSLNLAKNEIHQLLNNGLQGLRSLQKLDMSDNKLYALYPLCFTGANTIGELILSGNMISEIAMGTFQPLESALEHLKLDNNQLKRLPEGLLDLNQKLQEVNLAGNELTENMVPYSLFEQCIELHTIDLSYNMFIDPPLETLQKATMVRNVRLDGNPFVALGENAISEIRSLESIRLSNMTTLTTIDEKAFTGLDQLDVISITNNPNLTYIHPGAFPVGDLPILREMYLTNNGLTQLSLRWFSGKTNLQKVEVHGNALLCDCNATWIRVYMDDSSVPWIQDWKMGNNSLYCASPLNMERGHVFSFPIEQFTCSPPYMVSSKISYPDSNTVTLSAYFEKGLPTAWWTLPNGDVMYPVHGGSSDTGVKEDFLFNYTTQSTLTITNFKNSLHIGTYTVTSENAGGQANFTLVVTSAPPQSFSTGEVVAILIGIFLILAILIVLVFVWMNKRRFGYRRMHAEQYDTGDESEGEGPSVSEEYANIVTQTNSGLPRSYGTAGAEVGSDSQPGPPDPKLPYTDEEYQDASSKPI